MRKLDIIKHYMMPLDKTCVYNVYANGCHSYLLTSKNELFYYNIFIVPFENPDQTIVLSNEESLEDLILTKCTYFSVVLMSIQGDEVETLYSYREMSSNYILN